MTTMRVNSFRILELFMWFSSYYRHQHLTPAISRRAGGLTSNHLNWASRARLHRLVGRRPPPFSLPAARAARPCSLLPPYLSSAHFLAALPLRPPTHSAPLKPR